MMNLALLSYWHVHAKDYEREAIANPGTEISVVWDEDVDRGAREAARIGARFESDLQAVLGDPSIDGVIVTTATSEHERVLTAAAWAGKHIFTEKVIASTTSGAQTVLEAVDQAGVTMMVCLPRLSNGYTRGLEGMLERGDLGSIGYFRMRVGHNGAVRSDSDPDGWLPPQFYRFSEAEGGALIDLGAHPLYLARHLVGLPESVSATYGYFTGRDVEDHAVVTLKYGSGAIAVAEVSFIDQPSTWELEIHGDRGMARVEMPEMQLRIRRAMANRRERSEWEAFDVPEDAPSPFDQWVACVESGTKNPANLALAFDLTRLAEAANRSAADGVSVRIDQE